MKVTLYQRASSGGYSIEGITKNLASHLPADVQRRIFIPRYSNKGIMNRLKSAFDAMSEQGDVNHITGDAHFLSYFLKKEKTILTIHDTEKLMSRDFGFIKRALYKLFWFTIPSFRCAYITTISEESKKNIVRYGGIPQDKIRLIHDAVDDKFRIISLTHQEKKELLQNENGKKTVLHISDKRKIKNISRLIEALKDLNIKFIKIGKLNSEDTALLAQYRIEYLQFQNVEIDLLVKLYNAADCLAFPSLIEGFGLPVIEAQACGCPVVTSNISSLPEVSGKGAVFVDPYSVESIRAGIIQILGDKDLRRRMIDNGFKNMARFSWNDIAKQYHELYSEVLLEDKTHSGAN